MSASDTQQTRRQRHLQARRALLARSAHKARLAGRTSITFPLTATGSAKEMALPAALQGLDGVAAP